MKEYSIKLTTREYLDAVERFASRRFQYYLEIAILKEVTEKQSNNSIFNELTSLSKFLSNTQSILRRIGTNSPETAKLSAEFRNNMEKSIKLLQGIIVDFPDGARIDFENRFLAISPDALNRFISFLYELSWIKNYNLDKKEVL